MGFGFFDRHNTSLATGRVAKDAQLTTEEVRLRVLAPLSKLLATAEKARTISKTEGNEKAQERLRDLKSCIAEVLEMGTPKHVAEGLYGMHESDENKAAEEEITASLIP